MPVLHGDNELQACAVTTTVIASYAATAMNDQIIRTTDPVIPVLNKVHEGQASAATTVEAVTVRQLATKAAATIRPKHVIKGPLTSLEKEFVRHIGIQKTREDKDVDQNYLFNAYEMAHEGYSRESIVLKNYWNNFKDSRTFKDIKESILNERTK